jgi:hypothetical protein
MRRGTTPTYTLTVDMDLTGWTCYVTLKGLGKLLNLEGERLAVEGGEQSTVTFELTQAETLALKPGKCEVQLRAAKNGAAIATDIATLDVGRILRDGEIHA